MAWFIKVDIFLILINAKSKNEDKNLLETMKILFQKISKDCMQNIQLMKIEDFSDF